MDIETIVNDVDSLDNIKTLISDDEDMQTQIVTQLVKRRIELGLSQRDLAETCNLKQSAIARFESFKGVPTIGTIYRISKALGYKIHIDFIPIN